MGRRRKEVDRKTEPDAPIANGFLTRVRSLIIRFAWSGVLTIRSVMKRRAQTTLPAK